MQQLSLPLNLPGIYPDKVVWFEKMLRSLSVSRSPSLYDEFGKSLHKAGNTLVLLAGKTANSQLLS